MKNPTTVDKVISENLCVGCGFCTIFNNKKKKMAYDDYGFLKPVVNMRLKEDQKVVFNKVCPGVCIDYNHKDFNTYNSDPLWGDYLNILQGYSNSNKIRNRASSGGVITALLHYLLISKQVDYVIQVGSSTSNPSRNETFITNRPQDVINNSGSRYSPSSPLIMCQKIIDTNARFAIVGKPCDISALKAYATVNPVIKKRVIFYFSFFCAGIPSQKGTEALLRKLNISENNVKSLNYRGDGWPGYFSVKTKDQKKFKLSYKESWGSELNKHLHLRCKICPDGVGSQADIVCADAWDTDKRGYPLFNEKSGKSLIFIRTEKGQKLLDQAIDKKAVVTENFDESKLQDIQPYQSKRKSAILYRLIALRLIGMNIPEYRKVGVLAASLKMNILAQLKSFAGMISRGLKYKYNNVHS